MGIHFHSTAIMIYPCSGFHFIVNEITRNKMKNCPKRFTAVDPACPVVLYKKFISIDHPLIFGMYIVTHPVLNKPERGGLGTEGGGGGLKRLRNPSCRVSRDRADHDRGTFVPPPNFAQFTSSRPD